MNKFEEMRELESNHLGIEKHKHKESYSEELHGNLHEHCHHNLKNKDLRI